MKRKNYSSLDAAILAVVAEAPRSKDALLAEEALRRLALNVYRPRAGESPAESTDKTLLASEQVAPHRTTCLRRLH